MIELFESDPLTLTAKFYVPPYSGILVDPTGTPALTVTIFIPGLGPTTYTYQVDEPLIKLAVGSYTITVPTTESVMQPSLPQVGYAQWRGYGAASKTGEDYFVIKPRSTPEFINGVNTDTGITPTPWQP